MKASAIERVEQLLAETHDADDALRVAVRALVADDDLVWAGVAFVEGDEITLGPAAGRPDETRRTRTPVPYQGVVIGELWVDGRADPALLEQIAERIAPYVLIGWDTGGEAWEP